MNLTLHLLKNKKNKPLANNPRESVTENEDNSDEKSEDFPNPADGSEKGRVFRDLEERSSTGEGIRDQDKPSPDQAFKRSSELHNKKKPVVTGDDGEMKSPSA